MGGIKGLLACDFGVLPKTQGGAMAGASSRPSSDPPSHGTIPTDPPRPHPTTASLVTLPPRPHRLALLLILGASINDADFLGGLRAMPRAKEKKRLVAVDADLLLGRGGGWDEEEAPSHRWTMAPANPAHRRVRTTRRGSRRSRGRPAHTNLVAVHRAETTTKAAARQRSSVDPFAKEDWYDIKAPSAFSMSRVLSEEAAFGDFFYDSDDREDEVLESHQVVILLARPARLASSNAHSASMKAADSVVQRGCFISLSFEVLEEA